jgi:glutaconate CoA-transferase, subunit B
MFRVITELVAFGFDDETRRMKVLALNPGVDRAQVQDDKGFELLFDEELSMTEPPTGRELETLRDLDPDRLFTA